MNSISVYCLSYNGSEGVLRSLESVRRQYDAQDIQLVISDDASTDNTVDLVRQYLEKFGKRFKSVIFKCHKENQGIIKNFCYALSLCDGDVVIGVSQGDLLYSRKISWNMRKYYQQRHFDFCVGFHKSYRYLDSDSLAFEEVNNMKPNFMDKFLVNRKKVRLPLILLGNMISGSAIVCSGKYAKDIPSICSGVEYLEDWTMFIDHILKGKKFCFYNNYIRWYERGFGISTDPNHSKKDKLKKDSQKMLEKFEPFVEGISKEIIKFNLEISKENSSRRSKLRILLLKYNKIIPLFLLRKIIFKLDFIFTFFTRCVLRERSSFEKILKMSAEEILQQGDKK